MKKTLIISALLLVGSLSAYSQGTVLFQDRQSDMTMHVYAPEVATPTVETTGQANSAVGVTADLYEDTVANGFATTGTIVTGGSTVYTGGAIGNTKSGSATPAGAYHYNVGSDFTVELYGASGYNQTSLAPLSQYTSVLSTSSTQGGTFVGVSVNNDPGIPSTTGNQATVALYAWYNGGIGLTLAQAQTAGDPWGVSLSDNITALGGLGSGTLSTPEDILGLQSFSLITPVPEPSTIALAVMGASALLFRRRK